MSNFEGKPYPSAGFTSAIVMAHEIGHNLGKFNVRTRLKIPFSPKLPDMAIEAVFNFANFSPGPARLLGILLMFSNQLFVYSFRNAP